MAESTGIYHKNPDGYKSLYGCKSNYITGFKYLHSPCVLSGQKYLSVCAIVSRVPPQHLLYENNPGNRLERQRCCPCPAR